MSKDYKALIEKQRAKLEEVRQESIDVALGGEVVSLTVRKLHPDVWDALVGGNSPRRTVESDALVGYNPKAVAKAYPHVSADGEELDAATWADMYSVLESTWKNNVEVLIWGLNVNEALKELRELGKARAGRKSPSPAN